MKHSDTVFKNPDELPPIHTIFDHLYGNSDVIKKDPIKVTEEHHEKDFVKILIFEKSGLYVYAYQIKVAKLIRQKVPQPLDIGVDSIADAHSAAWRESYKLFSANRTA
jgi:hypothetical protein